MARQADVILFLGNIRASDDPFDVDCGSCSGQPICGFPVLRVRKNSSEEANRFLQDVGDSLQKMVKINIDRQHRKVRGGLKKPQQGRALRIENLQSLRCKYEQQGC